MGRAVVSYDEQTTDAAVLERLIADAGYSASVAPAETNGDEAAV
jgi:hypothetical protein